MKYTAKDFAFWGTVLLTIESNIGGFLISLQFQSQNHYVLPIKIWGVVWGLILSNIIPGLLWFVYRKFRKYQGKVSEIVFLIIGVLLLVSGMMGVFHGGDLAMLLFLSGGFYIASYLTNLQKKKKLD
jgi:hypothetical protein